MTFNAAVHIMANLEKVVFLCVIDQGSLTRSILNLHYLVILEFDI